MNQSTSSSSPLTVICVGTGRDGTTSVAQMMQAIFDNEGQGRQAAHEWLAIDFYNEFCAFRERQDERHLNNIRRMISTCPFDCIVGNGYAPVLSHFAEMIGDQLRVVHLRRRDRARCIASLVENAKHFPTNHRYYTSYDAATGKRIAAFHYGEATREEWELWPIERRFAWYYDKTHALIDSTKHLFADAVEIETESLDNEEVRVALGRAAGTDFSPPPVHVNQHVKLDGIPVERRPWLQRLLGKIDLSRLATDNIYGLSHFLREHSLWLSFCVDRSQSGDVTPITELADDLARLRELLASYSMQLEHLARRLGSPLAPSEAERLKLACDRLAFDRDVTRAELEAAQIERDTIRAELNAIRTERDAIGAELNAIRNSTCWLVTGPLRHAVHRLKLT
jgi:hypothetical protein